MIRRSRGMLSSPATTPRRATTAQVQELVGRLLTRRMHLMTSTRSSDAVHTIAMTKALWTCSWSSFDLSTFLFASFIFYLLFVVTFNCPKNYIIVTCFTLFIYLSLLYSQCVWPCLHTMFWSNLFIMKVLMIIMTMCNDLLLKHHLKKVLLS